MSRPYLCLFVLVPCLLASANFARADLVPLSLADFAPESLVEGRSGMLDHATLPSGSACNETMCLYTWKQFSISPPVSRLYFIRTDLNGVPLDPFGQLLSEEGRSSSLESQVMWAHGHFNVVWRALEGHLNFRRISTAGILLDAAPRHIAQNIGNHRLIATDEGFLLVASIVVNAFSSTWMLQFLDQHGSPRGSELAFAGPSGGVVHDGIWMGDRALVVTSPRQGASTLHTIAADGTALAQSTLPLGAMGTNQSPVILARTTDGAVLLRASHVNGQYSVRRVAIAPDGTFNPASEVVLGETPENRPGWRVLLASQGEQGVLLWIQGIDSQQQASLLGRRFDLKTGWVDAQPFAVSGLVVGALEDARVMVAKDRFIPLWNDPFITGLRATCARPVAWAGDPGTPWCRTVAHVAGHPSAPELYRSGDGYLVRWRPRHREPNLTDQPRHLRFNKDGQRIDTTPIALPWVSHILGNGPRYIMSSFKAREGVTGFTGAIPTQEPLPEFFIRAPGGVRIGSAATWTGQHHLLAWGDNGNIFHLADAVAGALLRGDGTVDTSFTGVGTYRVDSRPRTVGSSVAVGSNGKEHLVVWVHDRPVGTLDETNNELALLNHNGAVIESHRFGDINDSAAIENTSCMGPAAIAADSTGFLIACGLSNNSSANRGIKLLGYTPGTPPRSLGLFALAGMSHPTIQTLRDGIHVYWTRDQEVVQSWIRRQGTGVEIVTDQHTFDFIPESARIQVDNDGRAALVYVRTVDTEPQLMFRLLDPDRPAPDAAAEPTVDAGVPGTSQSDAADVQDGSPTGTGCSCNVGRRSRATALWWLLTLGLLVRRKQRHWPWAALLLSVLVFGGCSEHQTLTARIDASVANDAMANSTEPSDALPSGSDASEVQRPSPGPPPTFTPAPPLTVEPPPQIVRVSTDIDCDNGVAAQIVGGDKFATVQGALTSANEGDVVQICPGTHSGGLRLQRGITLQSFSGDRTNTSFDGESKQNILSIAIQQGTRPLVIENLSFLNGIGTESPPGQGPPFWWCDTHCGGGAG